MSDRRPYHELERAVERMESELSAFAPMAQAMLRMEQRAADAEERARQSDRAARALERELTAMRRERDDARADVAELRDQRGSEAERVAYRRGYSTGYQAGSKGRPESPDRAMSDPRCVVRAVA